MHTTHLFTGPHKCNLRAHLAARLQKEKHESQLKFHSPQNTPGATQTNSVAATSEVAGDSF